MQELERDRALTEQNLLFRNVDLSSVEYMLERSRVRELAGGETLLQPELPNEHLYLILEGDLRVHLTAHQVVASPTRVLAVPHDTYGHLVGDAALKALANIMQINLRPHDLLVRYGGEEFAILLPETGVEEAVSVAERLRKMVAANEVTSHGVTFKIAISVGIASVTGGSSLEEVFAQADEALYRARENGRNRVEVAA